MVKKAQGSEAEKVLENPEALREKLFQSEDFFVKNRNIILGVIGVVVLAIAGFIAYNYIQENKNQEAQREMYASVFYFESDSLDKALQGDLKNPGLLTIADEYSSTKAGNLANFYIGSIYLKKGQYEDAISYLKEFDSDDLLVQARAFSMIGDAYLELNNNDEALNYYTKAINYKPNPQFTPQYLMKAALAAELKEDYARAIEFYGRVVDEFPRSQQINDAKKYKSRAQALTNNK